MQSSREYQNWIELGTPTTSSKRTIVIVGCGRSGTSMYSASLNAIGVFLGDRAKEPQFEDSRLSYAIESHKFEEARRIISEYNNRYDVWAFKRPSTKEHLDFLHESLRNPVYIFLFRDLAAIATRSVSDAEPLIKKIDQNLRDYQRILSFIKRSNLHGFICSFEKEKEDKLELIKKLELLALKRNEAPRSRSKAIDSISTCKRKYLEDYSNALLFGYLDSASINGISGWAAKRGSSQPVQILIDINGRTVGTSEANLPRDDVLKSGVHSSALCGFEFKFDIETQPRPGDTVSVKIADQSNQVSNSPIKIH